MLSIQVLCYSFIHIQYIFRVGLNCWNTYKVYQRITCHWIWWLTAGNLILQKIITWEVGLFGFRNWKLFHYYTVIFILLRLLHLKSIFYIFWFTPSQTILLVTVHWFQIFWPCCISEQPLWMVRHSTAEIFGTNLQTMFDAVWFGKCSYRFLQV